MSSEPTYNDFHLRVDKTFDSVKDTQRFGQYYFNCLDSLRPDLANKIRGSKLDPFFKDEIPAETMKFVAENWEEVPVGEHKGDIRGTEVDKNTVIIWFNSPDGDSSDSQHFELRCASHAQAVKIANRYNRIFNVTLGADTPYQHLVQSPEEVATYS